MVANFNNAATQDAQLNPMILHWPLSLRLVDAQFFEFCQANRELRIERTDQGDCEIMASTGVETSRRNISLAAQLYNWAEQEGGGIAFDSSGGFILPNGAIRSPDASWVRKTRLVTLTPKQKQQFLPLCPDFVIELRSPSDTLTILQAKMREYIENGAALGWLIDPETRQVSVYQPEVSPIVLDNPSCLLADTVLAGFKLDLQKIWNVPF